MTPTPLFPRLPGRGWLALLGGGEFSFGETEDADALWLAKTGEGEVGFVPAASGSIEYAGHFAAYLGEAFDRVVETVPIYRPRDARRGKNLDRLAASAAVYLGGGVPDQLLDALAGTPASEALEEKLTDGGVVVAIAAAAEATGEVARSIRRGEPIDGLGWLPGGVVEANFDPDHDRRLRKLMADPRVADRITWGVGIPAESALFLGPDGSYETLGPVFRLSAPDAELEEVETEAEL